MSTLVIAVVALIVGVVLATPFLIWTRGQPDAGMRFYAVGLGVTALIYVAFALIGGASGRSLVLEAVGLLLYGGAAWIGFRKATVVLALGWVLHPVWDVALHLNGAGAGYTCLRVLRGLRVFTDRPRSGSISGVNRGPAAPVRSTCNTAFQSPPTA